MRQLKRTLDLGDSTLLGIGAIIGAGIYVVLGLAAGVAGPGVILSIIIAGMAAGLSSLSFSELGSSMPREGGPYEFSRKILSPSIGFMVGWLWLASNIITGSAVSLGFAGYLGVLIPWLDQRLIALVAITFFSGINIIGVKRSARFNDLLVTLKLILILAFILLGAGSVKTSNFTPFLPLGPLGILQASALMFFAYGGFARITTVAEEVKDPGRTIPASILLALGISTIIYILTGIVAVGLVDWRALANSGSPLAVAIATTGIPWAVGVVSAGAMIATLSVLLVAVLGVSRVMFAMARNHDLPIGLSEVDPAYSTPVNSILVSTAIMILFVLSGDLKLIVGVSSFTLFIVHGLTNICALFVRKKFPRIDRPFKIPWYPLPPILGVLFCFGLAFTLPFDSWIVGLAVISIGIVYYLLFRPAR